MTWVGVVTLLIIVGGVIYAIWSEKKGIEHKFF